MRIQDDKAIDMAITAGFARAVFLPVQEIRSAFDHVPLHAPGLVYDPFLLLPSAASVLIAAMPYTWYTGWPEHCGEVSAYYFKSQDAHTALRSLAEKLTAQNVRVDTRQLLPTKWLGMLAGFGVFGKNSLLRNVLWGSCFTLRTLVTDIEPKQRYGAMHSQSCGECTKCMEACPVQALDGSGAVDATRCIRTYMLDGEITPKPLREAMGTRLLGCEVCQRVCPHNAMRASMQVPEPECFAIDKLLTGKRIDLNAIAIRIGWNEARLQRVQAQTALLAGNSGNQTYIPALQRLECHLNNTIAVHAKWAAQRLQQGMEDYHKEGE